MRKILLIDGNSIMNRAFYGIPLLMNKKGVYTNAIYGFLNIVFKAIEDTNSTDLMVSFDLKGPTFRHEMYDEYKGGRKKMPEELVPQMKAVKEVLKAMKVNIFEVSGYEADDVIGTFSKIASKSDYESVILSGDRDMLQLVANNVSVLIPKTRGGRTTYEMYDKKEVLSKYGLNPQELIEVKGLMGDSSDNIPGIPGVGEKTALKLIKTFKTIEKVYENKDSFTKKLKENVTTYYEQAILSRKLGRIITDIPIEVEFDKLCVEDMFNDEAFKVYKELELNSLLSKFKQKKDVKKDIVIKEDFDIDKLSTTKEDVYYYTFHEKFDYTMFTMDKSTYYFVKQSEDVIRGLLKNSNINKYSFDIKKQLANIDYSGEIIDKKIYDVTLIGYLLDPAKTDFSLSSLALEYLGQNIPTNEDFFGKGKKKKSVEHIDLEKIKSRMKQMLSALVSLSDLFVKKLEDGELKKLYFNIELPLLFVLYNMSKRGINVDGQALKEYSAELAGEIEILTKQIHELAGEEFNISSPKQLGFILFEKMNMPFAKKTKTGYSTSADILEKLSPYNPIIDLILKYRQYTKLKSTYTDGLYDYIKEDGKIHSNFRQMVVSTGRISSTDPNLQNIPIKYEIGKKIRKVFVPAEGNVFIDADYSQIELRILAHLSGDDTMIDAFSNNKDIHTITASNVFHVEMDEVTPIMRRRAKAVNFGIIYGISAFGLTRDLDIPISESKKYIDQYFSKYSKIKSFLDESVEIAKEKGYAQTIFGRKRIIRELKAKNFMQRSFGERIAMNTPIQGAAADIIKIAMVEVERKLTEGNYKSRLILQVHDELLIEAPEQELEEVQRLLKDTMENCVKLSVPLDVDANFGRNWFEAH